METTNNLLDDRVLEIGIFMSRLDQHEDAPVVDLQIPLVHIEYGWDTYEESENNNIIIDVDLLTIQTQEEGYSCEEGDWKQDKKEQFDSWEDLVKVFIINILEYFE